MNRRAFLATTTAALLGPAAVAQTTAPPVAPSRRFAGAAAYSAARDGAAMMVARNGIVLTEDYPGGPTDARWRIGSGTRAFAPLLAGTLIADRLMRLDEPVAMTLGEWGAHPVKSTITIRALLNGTSGIAFAPRGPTDVLTAISMEPAATPGAGFSNDAAPYVLLVEIARRKLANASRPITDPAAYLETKTLTPIGCTPVTWQRGPDGAPRFDDGAAVSVRGWTQVGELVRREGVWRAQQLVDDACLRNARLGTFAEAGVGMGFYLASAGPLRDAPFDSDLWRMNPAAPLDLIMAAGDGGQRLYIMPSTNMVVARMARTTAPGGDWSDAMFLTMILRDARV